MSKWTRLLPAALLLAVLATSAAPAQDLLRPDDTAVTALTYRGEQRWTWTSEDGETATVKLAFVALPSRDYLVAGSFLLDDAELGVTGSARWRGEHLVLDLTTSGGVRRQPPDAGKRKLFPADAVPALIDATGFAVLHAELDAGTLDGVSQQYQTNVVTGHHVQGPVHRNGTLKRIR